MPKTIGEILKHKRLDRKLSLDDAAGSTRIRYKYLEALENDQFDLLPSAVQGRGFLRAYAEFLELDPIPLLNHWETRTLIADAAEPLQTDAKLASSNRLNDGSDQFPEDELPSLEPEAAVEFYSAENAPEDEPAAAEPVLPITRRALTPPADAGKSAAHFQVVSGTLRNQREILGLSLSDIEQYTHIRQFYLQAIEEGRFNDLPSPVQAKGMIENYAQFLDINSDELMLEYAEGLQALREEKLTAERPPARAGVLPVKKPSKTAPKSLPARLLTPDLLIGSFVIILLVGFAIWTSGRVIANRNLQAQATIPGISDVLFSTTSPQPETPTTTAPLAVSTLDLNAANPSAADTENPASTDATPPPDGTAAATGEAGIAFDENAPIQLNIVINQRTYLKVIADDKTVFEGRSQPGNAYPYSAAESIEVIAGNAAALQVIYNEMDLGILGSFGEMVDLVFRGGAVMTPTPRFSPSPTGTLAPTITLQMPTPTFTPTVTPYIP